MKSAFFAGLCLSVTVWAQNPGGSKPRVFVADSPNAWSANYDWTGYRSGSHPQTAEIMKTFDQECDNVSVTSDRHNAQFIVVLERESQKVLRRDNKIVVFNQAGDLVFSASRRALGNAVRNFCSSLVTSGTTGVTASSAGKVPKNYWKTGKWPL